MRPSPEATMPVATIVSLKPEPQRFPCKTPVIESDLARKTRAGMRRPRKTDPALIAQRCSKGRAVMQVPGNRMSVNIQRALAGAFVDRILSDAEVEGISAPCAEIKSIESKSLNEGYWLAVCGKPRGPDLHRLPAGISRAAGAPGIHQQVAEPPRSAAARESHAKKPDFVSSPRREGGVDFV